MEDAECRFTSIEMFESLGAGTAGYFYGPPTQLEGAEAQLSDHWQAEGPNQAFHAVFSHLQ